MRAAGLVPAATLHELCNWMALHYVPQGNPAMTAEPDLLPCPWCGEKLTSVSVSEGSTSRWRKVDGCCADGPEVRHNTMAEDQEAAEVESRAAAIAAWNTRANVAHATAAKDAEIEALRAEVERVTCELVDATTRADKLAEALRELRNHTSVNSDQIALIDAALEQENDDA